MVCQVNDKPRYALVDVLSIELLEVHLQSVQEARTHANDYTNQHNLAIVRYFRNGNVVGEVNSWGEVTSKSRLANQIHFHLINQRLGRHFDRSVIDNARNSIKAVQGTITVPDEIQEGPTSRVRRWLDYIKLRLLK